MQRLFVKHLQSGAEKVLRASKDKVPYNANQEALKYLKSIQAIHVNHPSIEVDMAGMDKMRVLRKVETVSQAIKNDNPVDGLTVREAAQLDSTAMGNPLIRALLGKELKLDNSDLQAIRATNESAANMIEKNFSPKNISQP